MVRFPQSEVRLGRAAAVWPMTGVSATPWEVPLFILLAVPVIVAVAFVHRILQAVAPSNMLVQHVRRSRPNVRRAIGLAMLSLVLIALAHALERMIEAGSAAWLNLLVFVLL